MCRSLMRCGKGNKQKAYINNRQNINIKSWGGITNTYEAHSMIFVFLLLRPSKQQIKPV